jgi:hypothetical protein
MGENDGADPPAAIVETKVGDDGRDHRKADDDDAAPSSPRSHSHSRPFRLLLHGRDGCIPYLTPELTRLVFCPADDDSSDNGDDCPSNDWRWRREHFILGVAAKDTCVAAIYRDRGSSRDERDGSDRPSKRTRRERRSSGAITTSTDRTDVTPSISETTKGDENGDDGADPPRQEQRRSKTPCGYSFIAPSQSFRICASINSHIDREDANGARGKFDTSNYMHSHLRIPRYISTVIVPTFSLDHPGGTSDPDRNGGGDAAEGNADRNRHAPKKQVTEQNPHRRKRKQQQRQNKKDVIPNSTKDSMLVDTPHGWQKLTPEQYWGAVSSLARNLPSTLDSDTPSTALESSCVGAVGLFDHFGIPRDQIDNLLAEYPNDGNDGYDYSETNATTPARASLTGAAAAKGKWDALIQRLVQRTNEWSHRIASHRGRTGPSISFWTPVHVAASRLPLDSLLSCPVSRCSQGGRSQQNIVSECCNVAIVGWDAVGDSREIRCQAVRNLMTTMRSSPSPPRQYLVLSINDLRSILDAAKEGISIIGTDLVRQWSRNGKALCLDFSYDGSVKNETAYKTTGGLIELDGERYARDSSTLLPGCRCIACHPLLKSSSNRNGILDHTRPPTFSRAYIHHLIKAKEMLAETLLFVHNLHQMLFLLRQLSIKASLDAGESMHTRRMNLEDFCNMIEDQL